MKGIGKAKLLSIIILVEFILCISALIATPIVSNLLINSMEEIPFKVDNLSFIVTGSIYFVSVPFLFGLWKIRTISKLLSIEGYSCRKVGNNFIWISLASLLEIVFVILVQLFLWNKFKIFFYEWSIIVTVFIVLLCITFSLFSGVLSTAFRNMEPDADEEQ